MKQQTDQNTGNDILSSRLAELSHARMPQALKEKITLKAEKALKRRRRIANACAVSGIAIGCAAILAITCCVMAATDIDFSVLRRQADSMLAAIGTLDTRLCTIALCAAAIALFYILLDKILDRLNTHRDGTQITL